MGSHLRHDCKEPCAFSRSWWVSFFRNTIGEAYLSNSKSESETNSRIHDAELYADALRISGYEHHYSGFLRHYCRTNSKYWCITTTLALWFSATLGWADMNTKVLATATMASHWSEELRLKAGFRPEIELRVRLRSFENFWLRIRLKTKNDPPTGAYRRNFPLYFVNLL